MTIRLGEITAEPSKHGLICHSFFTQLPCIRFAALLSIAAYTILYYTVLYYIVMYYIVMYYTFDKNKLNT